MMFFHQKNNAFLSKPAFKVLEWYSLSVSKISGFQTIA